jgi:hypothetical protein
LKEPTRWRQEKRDEDDQDDQDLKENGDTQSETNIKYQHCDGKRGQNVTKDLRRGKFKSRRGF